MLLIIEEAFLVQTGIEFSRASLEKMIVRLRLSLPVSDTPRQTVSSRFVLCVGSYL